MLRLFGLGPAFESLYVKIDGWKKVLGEVILNSLSQLDPRTGAYVSRASPNSQSDEGAGTGNETVSDFLNIPLRTEEKACYTSCSASHSD